MLLYSAVFAIYITGTVLGQGQECLSGFPGRENVSKPLSDITQGQNASPQLRIFPAMTINCNGTITDIVVGGEFGTKQIPYPEIQIWRPVLEDGNMTYTTTPTRMVSIPLGCSFLSIYKSSVIKCNLVAPMSVEVGDIIGILLPRNRDNEVGYLIYFTETNIPSYDVPLSNTSFTIPPESTEPDYNVQPLLYLDIQTGEDNPSTPSTVTKSVTKRMKKATTTELIGPDNLTSIMPATVGACVAGITSLVLLAVVIVFIVLCVRQKRRRRRSANDSRSVKVEADPLNQQQYQRYSDTVLSSSMSHIRSIHVLDNPSYEYPGVNSATGSFDSVDSDNTVVVKTTVVTNVGLYGAQGDVHRPLSSKQSYDDPYMMQSGLSRSLPTNSHYEWGVVVPSQEVRNNLSLTNSYQSLKSGEGIYDVISRSQYGSSVSSGSIPTFFEECETFWTPATHASELYQQLATKKYREILRPQIQLTDFLGAGMFGTVSKGLWQSPAGAMPVAVKTMQSNDEAEKVRFLREAAIMGQFAHPNVVRLIGVVTVGEPFMIVLEFLTNGDLHGFLKKQRPVPGEMVPSGTPQLLVKFCQQIACGMEYLSRKSFVHRDLAARNILVSEDKTCKISDFGMSRDLLDDNYYMSHGGKVPVKWTAPEAILHKKYSTASDVWSFGCVMYEVWALGRKPFEGVTNMETIRMVDKGVRLSPPPGCPREVYKLMIECWHPNRSRRPSFHQLVEMLSQADFELLHWRDEDCHVHPQAKVVGAPLEAGENLYTDLCQTYLTALKAR